MLKAIESTKAPKTVLAVVGYGFSCKEIHLKHVTHCNRQILWTIFVNTRGVGGNLTMDRESIE